MEPIKYVGLLILGVFCCFLTLFFISDALGSIVRSKPEGMSGESTGFEELQNNLIALLMENGLDSLVMILYLLLAIYLLIVTIKGNSDLGFRFAIPTFYPMRSNETQMNAFLFNILIMNACCLSIAQNSCLKMPAYTSKTYIYKFSIIFAYSDLMFHFTQIHFLSWMTLVLCLLTIFLKIEHDFIPSLGPGHVQMLPKGCVI